MCCTQLLSRVQFFANPWTVASQAPLSVESFRQVCWSGFPFPTPGDLPDPGMEPVSPGSPALAGKFFTTAPPGKPLINYTSTKKKKDRCVLTKITYGDTRCCLLNTSIWLPQWTLYFRTINISTKLKGILESNHKEMNKLHHGTSTWNITQSSKMLWSWLQIRKC